MHRAGGATSDEWPVGECRYNPRMSLSPEEVEHIAHLARLELSDEEKARYREQLSAILDYVAKLQQLDTSSVPPMTAVFSANVSLRPDQARAPLDRKALLSNAPEVQDDQFKVPPVFE
jgi:aspartyl-tRNA(Asn)/glutamyl-tRNA(Gln) amidotransferase subunit C